jgi:hypothetical protein
MAAQSSRDPIAEREIFLTPGRMKPLPRPFPGLRLLVALSSLPPFRRFFFHSEPGLGLSAVSPWTHNGVSPTAVGAGRFHGSS